MICSDPSVVDQLLSQDLFSEQDQSQAGRGHDTPPSRLWHRTGARLHTDDLVVDESIVLDAISMAGFELVTSMHVPQAEYRFSKMF